MCVLVACAFEGRGTNAPADVSGIDVPVDPCVAPTTAWWDAAWGRRFHVATAGAPAMYTLRLDATTVLATALLASGDDVRAVVHDASGVTEIDRVIDPPFIELRVPSAGELWLYTGNPKAGAAPANRTTVFAFAESFDGLPIGSDAAVTFDPQPAADWHVIDDSGNHVYHASGAGRHPAGFRNLAFANGEIRARVQVGPLGGQNHNGLAARSNNLAPATMDGFVGQVLEDVDYSRVAEYQNGATPPLEHATLARAVDRGIWYVLRLRFVGSVVELYVNGILEAQLAGAGQADGQQLGLFAHDCDVSFDDVWMRAAIDPEPAATLGAPETRCN